MHPTLFTINWFALPPFLLTVKWSFWGGYNVIVFLYLYEIRYILSRTDTGKQYYVITILCNMLCYFCFLDLYGMQLSCLCFLALYETQCYLCFLGLCKLSSIVSGIIKCKCEESPESCCRWSVFRFIITTFRCLKNRTLFYNLLISHYQGSYTFKRKKKSH